MNFRKLGLTLSGGGGKGAYQIGVWQALRDLGLDSQLSAISGSSVGGLNGAMFAQGKLDQAKAMWLNIESRNMLSLQDVPGLTSRLALLTASGIISPVLSHFLSTKGFFKQDGLSSMIAEGLDAGRLASSALPLTVALHNCAANRVDYLSVRDTHTAAHMLLGTAALPLIFDEVTIGDSTYTDGGFYWGLPHKQVDNTPIRPLIEAGCDTILVVYLSPDDLSIDRGITLACASCRSCRPIAWVGSARRSTSPTKVPQDAWNRLCRRPPGPAPPATVPRQRGPVPGPLGTRPAGRRTRAHAQRQAR